VRELRGRGWSLAAIKEAVEKEFEDHPGGRRR